MEANDQPRQSVAWLVAEELAIAGAVVATVAGLGTALCLVIGAVRLARAFIG